jgi:hypothetical protein
MHVSNRLFTLFGATALAGALMACSGGGSDSKPAATSQPDAKPAATTASSASAQTREIELIKTPKPHADKLVEALKKNDLPGALAAYEAYDAAWNGIEVYTNFRDRKLYGEIEVDIQNKIGEALSAKPSSLASFVLMAEAMTKKYDEVIALSVKGPALHALFDDVATVRIVRADLRIVSSALQDNDVAKARTAYNKFKAGYAPAKALFSGRNAANEAEISAALAAADAKFMAANATADELKPLVQTLTDRYNYGVNLLNGAARNASLEKKAPTDKDLSDVAALNEANVALAATQKAWAAGDFNAAKAAHAKAVDAFTRAQPSLAAKNGDASVKTALDNYAALIAAAGDAAKVASSNRAAMEAVGVAQQVIAGQFWTDAKVKEYVAALPKA